MKKDAAPAVLRRPFIRLARTPIPRRVLDLLQNRAGVETIVSAMPSFHERDPQGPWAVFHAEVSNALARIAGTAGRAARVHKSDKAPEITVATNPRSARWIKLHAGKLAVELSRQQHEVIRNVVSRGYNTGARPEDMAAQLQRSIGLTSRQEEAVSNFYLRAVDEDEDTADARTDRYAQSQLVYRTENIARTENRSAVEHGRMDEWLQARDDGEISDASRRVWVSAHASQRLCELCEGMDGQEVGLEENFEADDGTSVPCPPLHPQCRCTCEIRVEVD